MDFRSFSFQAPKDWNQLKLDDYDSNAGPYSNPLDETSAVIIGGKDLMELLKVNLKFDTTEFVIIL
ncbi:hypothetical protein [Chryseobacterium sp. S90]|uniref:hypothetical protein n=1 Tax=Chryseobacterium sp. S90 TaxID=3395373 RepID=UPI0039BD66F1